MSEMRETAVENLNPAQVADLAVLVDLEARWENLRKTPSSAPEASSTLQDLQGRQKAYDAFRAKLAAYNHRYTPAHVPELLLNTPSRLALWCRTMRDLCLRVERDPQGHCPAHLLEKAYRWADRVGVRMNQHRVNRAEPPGSIRAAINNLEAVSQWCDDLAKAVAVPAPEASLVEGLVRLSAALRGRIVLYGRHHRPAAPLRAAQCGHCLTLHARSPPRATCPSRVPRQPQSSAQTRSGDQGRVTAEQGIADTKHDTGLNEPARNRTCHLPPDSYIQLQYRRL
jgi:hypothetical protein